MSFIMAALLGAAAAQRCWRWIWGPTWTLAGGLLVLVGLAAQSTLNVAWVEASLESAIGYPNVVTAFNMFAFGVTCSGAGILLWSMSSSRLNLHPVTHIAVGLGLAAIAAAMYLSAGPVPQELNGYIFDFKWAHTPEFAPAFMLALAYPLFTAVVCALGFFRVADDTILGRGAGLLATGVAVLAGYAVLRMTYLIGARFELIEPSYSVIQTGKLLAFPGVLLVVAGVMWHPMVTGLRGRAQAKNISALHRTLIGLCPGVVWHSRPGRSWEQKVTDQAVQVCDALAMLAERRNLRPVGDADPPTVAPEEIARWIDTGVPGRVRREHVVVSDVSTAWVESLGTAYMQVRSEDHTQCPLLTKSA